MDVLKTNPNDLVNRYLALDDIRKNYTSEQVKAINPAFIVMWVDDEDKEVIDINWEYAFFVAEDVHVKHLLRVLHDRDPNFVRDKVKPIQDKLKTIQEQDEIAKKILNCEPASQNVGKVVDINGKPLG